MALPPSAQANPRPEEESTPRWIPIALVGATVLAASVYVMTHLRHHPATVGTPEQSARDLVDYIATSEERRELGGLTNRSEVSAFLDRFFSRRDPTPGTPENEFRHEHERRFLYAQQVFRESGEGWRSDRGRVYILYGQPAETHRYAMIDVQFGPGRQWKAAEIWEYARPAGSNRLPPILSSPSLFDSALRGPMPPSGQMLFVFADLTGGGVYQQVFSTERQERIDPLIYGGSVNR